MYGKKKILFITLININYSLFEISNDRWNVLYLNGSSGFHFITLNLNRYIFRNINTIGLQSLTQHTTPLLYVFWCRNPIALKIRKIWDSFRGRGNFRGNCPIYRFKFTGKKRVESLYDFQMICHLHYVTECNRM